MHRAANKPTTMTIMLKHKNIQGVAAVLVIFLILYWFVGSDTASKYVNLNKKNDGAAEKVSDESAKYKEEVSNMEKIVQNIKSDMLKMKIDFEEEKKELTKKGGIICESQTLLIKEELTKSQKEIEEKGNALSKLEARISEISQTNDKLSNGNKELSQPLITKPFMGKKLVHFDLKGAPPKLNYLIEVMQYAKQFGADGFLIEYEDMFPWQQELTFLRSKYAYTEDDIAKILAAADRENMMVIPLIQTFGHLEFALKYEKLKHLRADKEIANVICPINNDSVPFIKKMISQMLQLHPNIELIHLGGDEVYNLKTCEKCRESKWDDYQLYTHHMFPLFKYVKTIKTSNGKDIQPIIWDDMLRKWDLDKLKIVAQHVTPMVWAYVPDLSTYHNFPNGMWDRFGAAFPALWIASSFKGALKPWSNYVPIKHHLDNHLSWLKIIASLDKMGSKVVGVTITGWSRFDHYGPFCELLPAGIPSLALCLRILSEGKFDSGLHESVSKQLKFNETFKIGVTNFKGYTPETAGFPGANVYHLVGALEKAIGWYDWTNVRITGWTRPYNQKRNFISYFQLNSSLFGLHQSKIRLDAVKLNASNALSAIFNKDTVDEWIEDKIDFYIKLVSDTINSVTVFKNRVNFI